MENGRLSSMTYIQLLEYLSSCYLACSSYSKVVLMEILNRYPDQYYKDLYEGIES